MTFRKLHKTNRVIQRLTIVPVAAFLSRMEGSHVLSRLLMIRLIQKLRDMLR